MRRRGYGLALLGQQEDGLRLCAGTGTRGFLFALDGIAAARPHNFGAFYPQSPAAACMRGLTLLPRRALASGSRWMARITVGECLHDGPMLAGDRLVLPPAERVVFVLRASRAVRANADPPRSSGPCIGHADNFDAINKGFDRTDGKL